jgi:excisionase family DNA binding protein
MNNDTQGQEAPEEAPATVSVPAAGRVLGLGRNAAYRAAKDGSLPSIRVGGRVLVPKRALERLLDGGGAETNGGAGSP